MGKEKKNYVMRLCFTFLFCSIGNNNYVLKVSKTPGTRVLIKLCNDCCTANYVITIITHSKT
jgi:hypothetical protein